MYTYACLHLYICIYKHVHVSIYVNTVVCDVVLSLHSRSLSCFLLFASILFQPISLPLSLFLAFSIAHTHTRTHAPAYTHAHTYAKIQHTPTAAAPFANMARLYPGNRPTQKKAVGRLRAGAGRASGTQAWNLLEVEVLVLL